MLEGPHPTHWCSRECPPPAVGSEAVDAKIFDASQNAVAICAITNLLAGESAPFGEVPVVMWSGWSSSREDHPAAVWGPGAWQSFVAWCDASASFQHAGVWFRPAAGHVLCDPQRCLSFLRDRATERIGLLHDPLAMLTESMRPLAKDHLLRSMEALGGHPRVRGVVFDPADPDAEILAPLIGEFVPADRPVVLARPPATP